ncbi:hypothetical protein [Selenomonas artemidis]|uniref:hypothetical protein n=1 Tax=Selenomonas artemidis TaxID=671224 RepID=UPI00288B8D80|nr:hypothetical protein [Selenomonas artemidis]
MTTANPPVSLMPNIQAPLASLCATFQQAKLSSQENQQRALQQMQEMLCRSLQHLAQSSRDSVENYQNVLNEALSSLNTRFDRLSPDQRTALIHDLTNERLQTATIDYLDWLVSQSEEASPRQLSTEILVRLTVSDSLESSLETPANAQEEAFKEEYEKLSPTTQEVVEETSRLKTLLVNRKFLMEIFTEWMKTDIFEIKLLGFICSLALGVAAALYNKPDPRKPDKDSEVS